MLNLPDAVTRAFPRKRSPKKLACVARRALCTVATRRKRRPSVREVANDSTTIAKSGSTYTIVPYGAGSVAPELVARWQRPPAAPQVQAQTQLQVTAPVRRSRTVAMQSQTRATQSRTVLAAQSPTAATQSPAVTTPTRSAVHAWTYPTPPASPAPSEESGIVPHARIYPRCTQVPRVLVPARGAAP